MATSVFERSGLEKFFSQESNISPSNLWNTHSSNLTSNDISNGLLEPNGTEIRSRCSLDAKCTFNIPGRLLESITSTNHANTSTSQIQSVGERGVKTFTEGREVNIACSEKKRQDSAGVYKHPRRKTIGSKISPAENSLVRKTYSTDIGTVSGINDEVRQHNYEPGVSITDGSRSSVQLQPLRCFIQIRTRNRTADTPAVKDDSIRSWSNKEPDPVLFRDDSIRGSAESGEPCCSQDAAEPGKDRIAGGPAHDREDHALGSAPPGQRVAELRAGPCTRPERGAGRTGASHGETGALEFNKRTGEVVRAPSVSSLVKESEAAPPNSADWKFLPKTGLGPTNITKGQRGTLVEPRSFTNLLTVDQQQCSRSDMPRECLAESGDLQSPHESVALKAHHECSVPFEKTASLEFTEPTAVDIIVCPLLWPRDGEKRCYEAWRLSTFSQVPDLAEFTIRLAHNGFYYDQTCNEIKCFSCGQLLGERQSPDTVATWHRALRPVCTHAHGNDDRNKPISEKSPRSDRLEHDGETTSGGLTKTAPSLPALLSERSGNTGLDTEASADSATRTVHHGGPSTADNGTVIDTADQRRTPTAGTVSASTATRHAGRSSSSIGRSVTTAASVSSSSAVVTHIASVSSSSAVVTHNASTSPTQYNSNPASPQDYGVEMDVRELRAREEAWAISGLDRRLAASLSLSFATSRMQSFADWPAESRPSPLRMVLAGFFYLGVGDSVQCFYCGITLRNWRQNDDPWVMHVQFRFSCAYVKAIKGVEFVRQTSSRLAARRGRNPDSAQSSAPRAEAQSTPSESVSAEPLSAPPLSPTATPNNATRPPPPSGTVRTSAPIPRISADAPVSAHSARSASAESEERQDAAPSVGDPVASSANAAPRSGSAMPNINLTSATLLANAGRPITAQVYHVHQTLTTGEASTQTASDASPVHPDTEHRRSAGQDTTTSSGRANPAVSDHANTRADRTGPNQAHTHTNGRASTTLRGSHSEPPQSDEERATMAQNAARSTTSLPSASTSRDVFRNHRVHPPGSDVGQAERQPLSGTQRADEVDERAHAQRLEEANQRLRQRHTCRLCGERNVDTIFMPCGHLCTCASCANTIGRCPVCNIQIRATAVVYFA